MDQLDARLRAFRHQDFNDIEAEENVWIVEHPKPGERAARDPLPFVTINRLDRPAKILPRTRLHFHKHERIAVAADDIEFTASAAAEVAIQHLVAVPPQITTGELLAQRAALEVLRMRTRKAAAPPARKTGDGLDKARVHEVS